MRLPPTLRIPIGRAVTHTVEPSSPKRGSAFASLDKEALFRIAQEALNNTAKHARASHVELRLESAGEALVAEIRDDGAGFDAGGQFPGHLGLRSMRERASRLGGAVEIISSAGQGTIVRAMIPRRAGA